MSPVWDSAAGTPVKPRHCGDVDCELLLEGRAKDAGWWRWMSPSSGQRHHPWDRITIGGDKTRSHALRAARPGGCWCVRLWDVIPSPPPVPARSKIERGSSERGQGQLEGGPGDRADSPPAQRLQR